MTRRRSELGTIDTSASDLGELVRTKISEDIVEAQRNRQVGDQLVISSNALKNKEDDSIKFYERGSVSASEVSEGDSIESNAQSEPSYSEVLVAEAQKFAVYDAITREAIEDARVDIVDGVTEEMGESLADKKDSLILERLCNDTSVTGESPSANPFTVSTTPILSIDNAEGGSVIDWDPATGKVKADATLSTIDYTAARSPSVNSNTAETISMSDISSAKYKVTSKRLSPDKLVVSPKFISFLEQNKNFIDANVYQGELPQGVEGKLYGMDVLLSDNLPGQTSDGGYIALLVDSDKAIPFLPKVDLKVERKDNPDEQVLKIYASERYAVGGNDTSPSRLLRDNAVSVLAIEHTVS